MNANQFGKLSSAKLATLDNYLNKEAALMVVRETLRFVDDNFRLQGWQGVTFRPWQPNKKGTRILVKSGALRRGMNYQVQGDTVRFYNNIVYADIHNRGGVVSRAPRSETFVRNRYEKGKRKGLFRKGATAGQGFEFKAYTIQM